MALSRLDVRTKTPSPTHSFGLLFPQRWLGLVSSQIMCWELVSKRGGAWIPHYIKLAYAVTYVPDQVRNHGYPILHTNEREGSRVNLPASTMS
jgi:hypothetical protein